MDWTGECWDKSAWIQSEEGIGLVVRVYFDVLVRDLFFLQSEPDSLDWLVSIVDRCVGDEYRI